MPVLFYHVALFFAAITSAGHPSIPTVNEPLTNTVFLPVAVHSWPPVWDWQETETVEGIDFTRNAVQSIFDEQGRLHLFWDSGIVSVPKFIYHAYRQPNGWVDAYPVAQSVGVSELGPKPVLTQDGTLHLLWVNEVISDTQTNNRLLYASFVDDSWSEAQELYRTTSSVSGWLQIDTTQQLHLYIRDSAIYTQIQHGVKTTMGVTWLDSIDLPDRIDWIWPDYNNGVRMYFGQSQTETQYSRWSQGGYDPFEQSIPDLDIRARSTLLDGQNALHIFWRATISIPGGTANAVLHQCLPGNLNLSMIEIPSGNESVSTPLVGADQQGWFVVGWLAETGVQVGLWNSCTWVGQSHAPQSADVGVSVRSVVADKKTNRVCVISRQFLSETHKVACAYLR